MHTNWGDNNLDAALILLSDDNAIVRAAGSGICDCLEDAEVGSCGLAFQVAKLLVAADRRT